MSTRTPLGLFILLFALPVWAESYLGQVVGISDGDTIVVLDSSNVQHKVRLAGIDAPEKRQAFGNISKQHLSRLVFGKTVTIETGKKDRFKREIGKVLVGEIDANLEQVRAGLAWHYKRYQSEQLLIDREKYAHAEEEARRKRLGLWKDSNPVAPWEFRHPAKNRQELPRPLGK